MSVRFSPETCSLLVSVQRPEDVLNALAKSALADGFEEKPEFHITILSGLPAERVSPALVDGCGQAISRANGVVPDFKLVRNAVWRIRNPKVVEGQSYERESIVVAVQSRYVTGLYTQLAQYTDLPLRQPFPHITLYTKGDEPFASRGIGIETWDAFMGLPFEPYGKESMSGLLN